METNQMKIRVKFILFFFAGFCMICCNKTQTRNQDSLEHDRRSVNPGFNEFLKNFEDLNLPTSLGLLCQGKQGLTMNSNEIPRDTVVKYLLDKNTQRLNQPTGGRFQYFYGYRIVEVPSDLVAIIYARPSYESYSAYFLGLFDRDGTNLGNLLISGDSTESSQKEVFINHNFEITTWEFFYSFKNNDNRDTIPGLVYQKKFLIENKRIVEKKDQEKKFNGKAVLNDRCGLTVLENDLVLISH